MPSPLSLVPQRPGTWADECGFASLEANTESSWESIGKRAITNHADFDEIDNRCQEGVAQMRNNLMARETKINTGHVSWSSYKHKDRLNMAPRDSLGESYDPKADRYSRLQAQYEAQIASAKEGDDSPVATDDA